MTTSPVQSVTEEMLAELQAKMETSDEGFSADEVEPLIATIRQQRADDASTSGNKYRAELYDEVWEQARSMGYGNVTNALVELERLRAAPEGITMERIERHAQPAGECPSSAKVVLLSSIKRLLAAPAAPAPAPATQDIPCWSPCNPACDPELNGFRSRSCDCDQAKAALAATSAATQEGADHE